MQNPKILELFLELSYSSLLIHKQFDTPVNRQRKQTTLTSGRMKQPGLKVVQQTGQAQVEP